MPIGNNKLYPKMGAAEEEAVAEKKNSTIKHPQLLSEYDLQNLLNFKNIT